MLENIHNILSLRQKHAIYGAGDSDAEEVVEFAEISHGELRTEFCLDVL
jgi:hypothetical protein